jgi:hypothetical protein
VTIPTQLSHLSDWDSKNTEYSNKFNTLEADYKKADADLKTALESEINK